MPRNQHMKENGLLFNMRDKLHAAEEEVQTTIAHYHSISYISCQNLFIKQLVSCFRIIT